MEPQISSRRLPYRDLNIRSRSAGGYDVASSANPNRGLGPYNGVVAGNYTMLERPEAEDRTVNNLFALGENRGLAERGEAMQEADRREAYERNPFSTQGIKTVERDPRWQALFQAMWEQGSAPNASDWGSVRSEERSAMFDPTDKARLYGGDAALLQAQKMNPKDLELFAAMRRGR